MKVLVDTCVWSMALRRKEKPVEDPYVLELNELIDELRVQMIGPIRQELLSGIRLQSQFETLRDHLQVFDDLPLTMHDYERAADFYNQLRRRGIQGSNTDFLLCAVSDRYKMPILTTDEDFALFAKHISISLHTPRTFSSQVKLTQEELDDFAKDLEDIREELREHNEMI